MTLGEIPTAAEIVIADEVIATLQRLCTAEDGTNPVHVCLAVWLTLTNALVELDCSEDEMVDYVQRAKVLNRISRQMS